MFVEINNVLIYIYWSYTENRVSTHFVIFPNFACLIACLLCCLPVSFFLFVCLWLGICVEEDVHRITILLSIPPYVFLSLPTILSLTQVEVIRNQCAPKAGFGAV